MTWKLANKMAGLAVTAGAAVLIAMVVLVQFWSLLPARKALATTPTPTNTFTPLPPATHKVGGTVCDGFLPSVPYQTTCMGLIGATIRLDPGGQSTITDKFGQFSFPGVSDGSYTIRVESAPNSTIYLPVVITVNGTGAFVQIYQTPRTPAGVCGDANGDDVVNALDALRTLQYVVRLVDNLARIDLADADGNGNITSVDAALILQMDAGLIDLRLPPCSGAV